MRVLLINSVCGIGSTGRICTALAKDFESQGHTVRIAYGRNGNVPSDCIKYAVRIGTEVDVRVHGAVTRLFDLHGFASKNATNIFLKWAQDYDPDLIWLHNLHGYYIHVERLFQWLKERRMTEIRWTLHDCWAFTGHCAYFSYAGCNRWKGVGCGECPQLRSYPQTFFFDRTAENYKRKKAAFCGLEDMQLITPSEWLAKLVEQSFLSCYPVRVEHNRINTDIFKSCESGFRREFHLEHKCIILGVASAWDERKGLRDFIKLNQMLDEHYQLVLIGLSTRQIIELPKDMIGLPRTESARELAGVYSAADVFFNPTYEDNYPTVNLEAEACGTDVITYDAGGAAETIRRQKSKVIPVGAVEEAYRYLIHELHTEKL